MDKLRRKFLWEGCSKTHKFPLVKWLKATQPKFKGGLGIRDLQVHNKAMLLKWLWRYGQEESRLWKDIIVAKYGAHNHWCSKKTNTPHGVDLWKNISNHGYEFFQNATFKVGNGTSIKFWKDRWFGNTPLKDMFPGMYHIALNKDSDVAQNRDNGTWCPLFRRNLQDWEVNSLLTMLSSLGHNIEDQQPDKLIWGNSKRGKYTVKEGYIHLCDQNPIIDNWPWKHIWRTKVSTKVTCFTWLSLNGACVTQGNLIKRNITLVNRCYMCQQQSESVNHLFLHCSVAKEIWNFFYTIFGLKWVMPQSTKQAFESWYFWRVGKSIRKIWKMVPAAIFWCIWKERNRRCFDGISTPLYSLKAACLVNLFSWNYLTPDNSADTFVDFISSLIVA
nr:uncharacterized protein LOC104090014 isoform X2 [Nicotiana tomentosiformis]